MFKTIAATICACVAAVTLSAQTPAPAKPMSPAAPQKTAVAKATVKDTPPHFAKRRRFPRRLRARPPSRKFPTARLSHELERENGNLIWSFDIKVAGKSGTEEVTVNAVTGAVVTHRARNA